MRHLRIGEDVIGPDGKELGSVDRLVVDEDAHAISHLVVDDHVVGVGHFRFDDDGTLHGDLTAEQLAAMPDVHDAEVAGAPGHWEPPAGYTLDNFLRIAGALIGQGPYVPPVQIQPDLAQVHELTEGSPVWYRDHKLGELVMVLTGDAGEVEQLVVKHGAFAESHLVSPEHVLEVVGNNVHVDIDPDAFRALPRYVEDADPASA